jgi:RNA polymerase sigma-70 factor, ECF subfamily
MAAARGDAAAMDAFIRATHQEVVRFLTYLAGPSDAEDLAQETYVRALGSVRRFSGRGHGRSWLLSIAHRVVVDSIRSATARPRTVAGGDGWQDHLERAALPGIGVEDSVSLSLAVQGLRQDRKEAFVLTQILGLGYAEAAKVCDCPVGTIRSRVARARSDLVAALAGDTCDGSHAVNE